MTTGIALIVGLGNPGSEYESTRHNAGFWFLDKLADDHRLVFRKEAKFFGEVAKLQTSIGPVWLLKPTTFMNHSGRSVSAMLNFYKLSAERMLVVHDELDHDPGSVKLKLDGGHAGHNGLRDIISALGSKGFYRLRLGVGHPGSKDKVVNYVLGVPSKDDRERIDETIGKVFGVLPKLYEGEFHRAMNELNK